MTPTAEKRVSFYVKPGRRSSVPCSVVILDTETRPIVYPDEPATQHHVLQLGIAIHLRREEGQWTRRKVHEFDQPEAFWEWFFLRLSPRKPTWCFAHNAGFDATAIRLWAEMEAGRLRLRESAVERAAREARPSKARREWRGAVVIEDPPTLLRLRHDNGTAVIVDTVNYLPMCLSEIGDGLGVKKLDRPLPDAPIDEIRAYCRRDVEILERAVCGLIDAWERSEAGTWQGTAASLAYTSWKRTIPPKTVLIDHGPEHTSLSREGYYGGQVECFYIGPIRPVAGQLDTRPQPAAIAATTGTTGPVYHLDVRSMYPSVMLGARFPTAIRGTWEHMDVEELRKRMIHFQSVAEVKIRSATDTYPHRRKGKVNYVTGEFWTVLAGDELTGAIDRGHVVRVGRTALYYSAPIFDAYVKQWWAFRAKALAEGHHADNLFGKMMLNSLTGYFAKRRAIWADRFDVGARQEWGAYTSWDVDKGKIIGYRAIAGHVQERREGGESRESFPAISACITAAGREKMRWYRSLCPPDSILYQDTDCLFCLQEAFSALDDRGLVGGEHLGALRIEGVYDHGHVYGPKDYRLGDTVVISGVKRPKDVTAAGGYTQDEFEGLSSILSRGPDAVVRVTQNEYSLSRRYGLDRLSRGGWLEPLSVMSQEEVPF